MTGALDLLSADIQSYVVAPMAAFGLAGFMFDIEGESTANLNAEITDHFTEDNKAVQDHIARKPKQITLKGYVGEVVYNNSDSASSIIGSVVQKLTTVAAFLPQVSAATQQVQNLVNGTTSLSNISLSSASDIYALVKNILGAFGDTAKQQNAYTYFVAMWQQGTLMGVQTPWEFMPNMVIESITAIQGEESKYISDFSIRLKQMRFAKTTTTAFNGANSPGAQGGAAGSGGLLGGLSTAAGNFASDVGGAVNSFASSVQETVLSGVASIQAALPTNLGINQGAALPTDLLPGAQSQIITASDILKGTLPAVFQYNAKIPVPSPPSSP